MIDGHVHLEKGPYRKEWINQFISYALERGITEIHFLEHTHIFKECEGLYKEMSNYNTYQHNWFQKKKASSRPIAEYIQFIEKMKQEDFPIRLQFGLEVCYSPEQEEEIERIKALYPFDFLTGSIHFIDGWAFSHLKQIWSKQDYDMDALYHRYYQLMYELATSGLFTVLAHPNSLQCYGAYPEGDYREDYVRIAHRLKEAKMQIEDSSGLAISYGDTRLGMNEVMLKVMLQQKVSILTVSDAHYPKDIGRYIKEMNQRILLIQ